MKSRKNLLLTSSLTLASVLPIVTIVSCKNENNNNTTKPVFVDGSIVREETKVTITINGKNLSSIKKEDAFDVINVKDPNQTPIKGWQISEITSDKIVMVLTQEVENSFAIGKYKISFKDKDLSIELTLEGKPTFSNEGFSSISSSEGLVSINVQGTDLNSLINPNQIKVIEVDTKQEIKGWNVFSTWDFLFLTLETTEPVVQEGKSYEVSLVEFPDVKITLTLEPMEPISS